MKSKLQDLRSTMYEHGLEVLLIQNVDEYQSGHIREHFQRIRWLCGFTGSYAQVIICKEGKCKFFTDSRYTIQASLEVDSAYFDLYNISDTPVASWMETNLPKGATIGYYGELFTLYQASRLKSFNLKMLSCNTLDRLWDRPMEIQQRIVNHPVRYAGITSSEKRDLVWAKVNNCEAILMTDVDSISWLLNIRNLTFVYNPAVLARAILYRDGRVDLFVDGVDKANIDDKTVNIRDIRELSSALECLSGILVDRSTVPMSIYVPIQDRVSRIEESDPCTQLKAQKNSTEIEGMKNSHIRDGVAIVNFLHWLKCALAGNQSVTEMDAAAKMGSYRRQQALFLGESFETISGFNSNGAIVHYRVTQSSNLPIEGDGLYLIDSGGQYYDGTTDVTRTVAIGTPSAEQIERFTLVLKGFIAVSRAVFPRGTSGGALDALARQYLWKEQLNYGHSTGHGVGSFLSVHEGPQAISASNSVELIPGMVLSNEPGYYKHNGYGIRTENLMYVADAGNGFYRFEQLTCVPIDRNVIDREMLDCSEIEFLDRYHSNVYKTISPYVGEEVKSWLLNQSSYVLRLNSLLHCPALAEIAMLCTSTV